MVREDTNHGFIINVCKSEKCYAKVLKIKRFIKSFCYVNEGKEKATLYIFINQIIMITGCLFIQ